MSDQEAEVAVAKNRLAAKRRAQLDRLIESRKSTPSWGIREPRVQYMRGVSEIVFMLLGAEMTCEEIAADTGISLNTVRYIIKEFRAIEGIVFISGWKRAKGGNAHHLVPVYTMKRRKEDAPRPEPKSRKQIAADYRARKRKAAAVANGAIAAMTSQLITAGAE